MLSATQAASAAYLAFAALVGLNASWTLRRRRVQAADAPALAALRAFWLGLAATATLQILFLVASRTGLGSARGAVLGLVVASNLASALAIGGLVAYFAHVLTGRRRVFQGAVALYVALFAWVVLLVARLDPTSIEPTRWFAKTNAAHEPGAAQATLTTVAFLLPAIVGSFLFVALGARSRGATRYRGLLVGCALVLWFGTSLASAALPAAAAADAAQVAVRLFGAMGLVALMLAYHPPAWAQRRWGLVALGDEPLYDARREQARTDRGLRRQELARRTRDLL